MEQHRRTLDTRFDLNFLWITKYRMRLLQADVGIRVRQIVRDNCSKMEGEIVERLPVCALFVILFAALLASGE